MENILFIHDKDKNLQPIVRDRLKKIINRLPTIFNRSPMGFDQIS